MIDWNFDHLGLAFLALVPSVLQSILVINLSILKLDNQLREKIENHLKRL